MKRVIFNQFPTLKSLLGFWACCTDITSSGIRACQCFHGEKANEPVRMSLHHYIPKNTVAARTSPVRMFFSREVVMCWLDPNSLNCKEASRFLPTLFVHLIYLFPFSLLLSCYWTKGSSPGAGCNNKKNEIPDCCHWPQGGA